MPTPARILQIAPVAQYLASNYVSKRSLYGGSPDNNLPITIFMVYKIVKKIYDNDPTYSGMQAVCNYLYELIGRWAFLAAAIVDGNTGGVVVPPSPPGSTTVYPLLITEAEFEPDGISYDNPDIVGDNLVLFVNEYAQINLVAGPTTFSYTPTGIIINIAGFDANTQTWTILIQKVN